MRGFLVLAPGTGGLFPLLASSEALLALEQARRARGGLNRNCPMTALCHTLCS